MAAFVQKLFLFPSFFRCTIFLFFHPAHCRITAMVAFVTASERINGRTTSATACRHLGHAAERGRKTDREGEREQKMKGARQQGREREMRERGLSPRSVYLSETEQSLSCSVSVRIGAGAEHSWLLLLKMSNACASARVRVSVYEFKISLTALGRKSCVSWPQCCRRGSNLLRNWLQLTLKLVLRLFCFFMFVLLQPSLKWIFELFFEIWWDF